MSAYNRLSVLWPYAQGVTQRLMMRLCALLPVVSCAESAKQCSRRFILCWLGDHGGKPLHKVRDWLHRPPAERGDKAAIR